MEREIGHRLDRIPGVLKEDAYPVAQAFVRTFKQATAIVEQYNRDLAAGERQDKGKPKPQQKPPEKESIGERLRRLEAENKRKPQPRQKPRRRQLDTER